MRPRVAARGGTESGKQRADFVTRRARVGVSLGVGAAEEPSRELDDDAVVADVVFEGVAGREPRAGRGESRA